MDQMCSDTIKLYYLGSIYMNIGSIYIYACNSFFRGIFGGLWQPWLKFYFKSLFSLKLSELFFFNNLALF